mmetsp:Transcript_14862/g.21266  ORF Transcript_14862/g.21266 Transcript_14862/m.21266 type:complete len:325 (-) Transcript_14862:91-1065(-)
MASNITSRDNSQQPKRQKRGNFLEYGAVDQSTLHTQMWLSKIPPKLASVWDGAPEGTFLGTLTFTKGGSVPKHAQQQNPNPKNTTNNNGSQNSSTKQTYTKPLIQKLGVQVAEQLSGDVSDLPLDYTLTGLTKDIPTLHPFARLPNGKIILKGTVTRSCSLQMERTQRYRDMCKARLKEIVAGKDKQSVRPVDLGDISLRGVIPGTRYNAIGSGFGETIASFGKKMLNAQRDLQTSLLSQGSKKRKFDENQDTRSILFELFSQERYWTLKGLRAASGGRSEKDIRAELSVIAEFRKAGEFKGMWELKKEFTGQVNDKSEKVNDT